MGFLTISLASTRILIKRLWPVLLALGIFAATTAVVWGLILKKNGGKFVYTLDDPYIHMAIAKNVVQHGVWGVTAYQFSSSSSSPLWTLLLALLYGLFGVSEIIPFMLNLFFAGLAIGLVYAPLRRHLPGWTIFLALLAVIFFPPLVPLVFSGMEHTAQLLLTLSTVALAAKTLSEDTPSRRTKSWLLVSAFLLTAIRYEGLFLILVLGILFACRKRWWFALLLAVIGVLPMTGYGLWSVGRGWYFLPNPVILKGTDGNQVLINFVKDIFLHGRPLTWQAIDRLKPVLFISRINANPHVLVLVISSLLLLVYRRGSFWGPGNLTNTAFLGTALLHMQFASTGWFYRYEAYLVAFGVYALAVGVGETALLSDNGWSLSERLLRVGAVLVLGFRFSSPLRVRAAISLRDTPQAAHNIFEQQYQMAAFLRQFYQGQVVAANDIGAIDFLADIRLVDLAGLGTREVAAMKLKQFYGAPQISAVADQYQTQIALVYDSWFQIPSDWVKAGEWQIPHNVVCGDSTVSFYAVNPSAALDLIERLQTFERQLPKDVAQRGY